VSQKDDHFFNTFSVVIGVLVAIAIGLIILARSIGYPFEQARIDDDQKMTDLVDARTAPIGQIALAGQDNSALAIKTANDDAGTALPLPANAQETFKAVCSACHAAGIAGAPKAGDHAAWAARIAQGQTVLYSHAINGFKGKNGVMPAKGGRSDLPDELVKQTVDYLVGMAK